MEEIIRVHILYMTYTWYVACMYIRSIYCLNIHIAWCQTAYFQFLNLKWVGKIFSISLAKGWFPFLLCFPLVGECFILIFSFQESISHPCCLAASGWARNEEEGPRPWKPSHVSGWMSLYLPPLPDKSFGPKALFKAGALLFLNKYWEPSFLFQRCLALTQPLSFQVPLELPAQAQCRGSPLSPLHTLSCRCKWTRKFSEATGPSS